MRKILLLLTAAVMTLTACGSDTARDSSADPDLPAASASASETTAEDSGPSRNERGNLVKALGEEGGFCADADCAEPMLVTFTVDAITVDPDCNSGYPQPAENGHLIAISLRAATSAELTPDAFVSFSASDFKVIGPDGLTVSSLGTAAAYSCLDQADMFEPGPLGPGQQYAGQIVVDSPTATGSLVYAPPAAQGGWEWHF